MLLGRKIKKSREEQGVLQRQLAALLDIDTPMFSKIERGERRAKREQVIKIAEYFNVKIDNVSIEIVPVCTGYGMMEHDEYHMKVTVKV